MMEENMKGATPPEDNPYGIRPDILNADDIVKMVPALANHRGLVERAMKILMLDKCNEVHARWCHTSGVPFAHHLVADEFKFKLRVDNEEILDRFKEGPFITVSNHPFGSYDGIVLIDLVGRHRPDYKVMVNLLLNNISAMRPSFIAVDPIKTDDPEKKKITMQGIREAMRRIKEGHPVGFFPAGAVSKLGWNLKIRDRQWQPTIIRLIQQMKVPVVPIFFHGHNSALFNFLGVIDWRLRSLWLPHELFRRVGKEVHVSIGEPISPEEQASCKSLDELGELLRRHTYALSKLP